MSRIVLLISISLIALISVLNAQNKPNDSLPKPVITLEAIPDKSIEFENRTDAIKTFINENEDVEKYRQNLALFKDRVHNTDIEFRAIENLDFTDLKLIKWDRIFTQLSDSAIFYGNIFNSVADSLNLYYKELDTWHKLWLNTEHELSKTKMSAVLKQNVQNLKIEARSLRGETKQLELDYINLKYDCNELQHIINEGNTRVKELRIALINSLFIAEQPILWKAFDKTGKPSAISINELGIGEILDNSISYLKSNPTFVVFGILLFIFFSIVFSWVYKQLGKNKAILDISLNPISMAILNMPYVISFLLSWVLLLMFYQVPIEIRTIVQAMLILPLIIIISRVFNKLKWLVIIVFSSFYLFNLAGALLNPNNFYTRISFVILALVSFLLFALIARKSNLFKKVFKWGGFVSVVLYGILILLAFALVFLIAGNVNIGKLMLMGSISIMLSSVIFYVIYQLILVYLQFLLINNAVQKLNVVRIYSNDIFKGLNKLLMAILVVFWVITVMKGFGLREEFIMLLKNIYNYKLAFGDNSIHVGHIFMFFLTIYLSILISRITIILLNEEVFPRSNTDKGVSNTISLLLRYSIIAIGFILALTAAGIDMSQISIIIGALGVGIGFGLQNIFNNLISGIILALERPINIDDTIQVGELTGVVKSIGFRSSKVLTYDGAEVIVPNGDIISNQMINYTLSDRKRRVRIKVGVGYDSDPKEVLDILEDLAMNHPDIEQEPIPRARFVGFGDSSIDFQLLFWISDFDNGPFVETDIMVKLFNTLKAKGIKIPFPQRDITIVREFDKPNNK